MGDGGDDIGQRSAIVNQPIELVMGLNRHRGQFGPGRDNLVRRRDHLDRGFHHRLAALVDSGTGEYHSPGVRAFFPRLGGQGEGIVQMDRPQVAERLAGEHAAWPRQLAAKQPREQTGHPHAVANPLTGLMLAGKVFVQVGGIQVAGQRGKELNIQRFQGTGQAGLFADLDLGEGAVGHRVGVHGNSSQSRRRRLIL